MRRTQLYLDDHLWDALQTRARSRKTTISALVRDAVRERYLGGQEERMKAMREFIGIRKESGASIDAVEYVRRMRRGERLDRLHQK
ncbi:MAG TPA: CopG family transcriptional regulator [Candidatus Sulfopaludibacter sp.]|nr:CopG family transcriptional regulator [Candidatus Sulfopaludibacter sp.]